ncbi:4Fe-4S ferredoxin [Parabacteroides distasonis]|uniref:4Fe-4S ferredoxin n=1 Tax=Parabacteroides distasonis TaxID=823 RepID=A0A1Y4IME8_PARDI|nr:Coenzyme F420 hydrogenase/dehydrogenase, beta subunit C-terminal domain [Parabacteroides distasonis]OUP20666.1 4Fe-4S ferredoxin [Parabacteroides distasonis]
MRNINEIKDCYGCGVCAMVCGKKIIGIGLNKEGFYEPRVVDPDRCVGCGLCLDVCSFLQEEPSLRRTEIHSYAAWSKDTVIRRKCSSGGVGFELGRTLIEEDYKVCGVRYDAERARAEHYIATTVKELIPSIGSKYIQSYTVDGFKAINRKEKYLVTGTPCQIDSFRRYIRKFNVEDNFVLMDFFCHGVPSMHLWQKYLQEVEKLTGNVTYVSWRNKLTAWHDSYDLLIRGEKSFYNSRLSQGDRFYRFFLSDACLGKACYERCKYKYDRSAADIRIGDLWGNTYKSNEDGVSAAVAFTEKGNKILCSCGCELIEHPFNVVAEGQMKECPCRPGLRSWILVRFCSGHSLRSTLIMYKLCCLPKRIINKLIRILKWEK